MPRTDVEIGATIVSFESTHQAFSFEDAAHADGFAGRLIPLPGAIAAGCGFAWKAPAGVGGVLEFIARRQLTVQEVHRYGDDGAYHRLERD